MSKINDKKARAIAKSIMDFTSLTHNSRDMVKSTDFTDLSYHEQVLKESEVKKSPIDFNIMNLTKTHDEIVKSYDPKLPKTDKNKTDMNNSKDAISKIKQNAGDITKQTESLSKKLDGQRKEDMKKDLVAKKFAENKTVTPSRKDLVAKKFAENKPVDKVKPKITDQFKENKKDILGDKKIEKKPPETPKSSGPKFK